MAKWEKRLEKILKSEKEKNKSIYELKDQLYKSIHGLSPIDKKLVEDTIAKQLEGWDCTFSINPKYSREPENEQYLSIEVSFKNEFKSKIIIKTGGGYRNTPEGRIDIYYVMESDCTIESKNESKVINYYRKFKNDSVEKMIELVVNNNLYVEYDDYFVKYEIWNKKPSQYEDSITGYLNVNREEKHYKEYKKQYNNISKISKHNDFKELCENLDSYGQSYTYEWTEYKL